MKLEYSVLYGRDFYAPLVISRQKANHPPIRTLTKKKKKKQTEK